MCFSLNNQRADLVVISYFSFSHCLFYYYLCRYVFHHIPDTPNLIHQLKKTCRRVLIFEDLPSSTNQPWVSKLTFGIHFLLFNQSVHTDHHHTRKEWRKLFKEWGMTMVKEYEVPPTSAIPYARIAFLLDTGDAE